MADVSLAAAAAAGVVSFLSPCVLPLVPGYISFVSGASLQELQSADARQVRRALVGSLWFVLGFSTIFILLGASATILGQLLLQRLELFKRFAGALIILFGLHLTGLVKLPFLNYDKHLQVKARPLTWLGAYGVGAAFGFGWTPCIGPILAGILALASTQETIGQGMLLLAAYSFGLGLPFLATSLGVQAFLRFFSRFRRYLRVVEVASGILLLLVGFLIMTNRLTLLSRTLTFFNQFSL